MSSELPQPDKNTPVQWKFRFHDSLRLHAFQACLVSMLLLALAIYAIVANQIQSEQARQADTMLQSRLHELQTDNSQHGTFDSAQSNQPVFYYHGNLEAARLTVDWPKNCELPAGHESGQGRIQIAQCSEGQLLHFMEVDSKSDEGQHDTLTVWTSFSNSDPIGNVSTPDLVSLGFLILLISFFSSDWISRCVRKPLRKLATTCEKVAAGRTDSPLPDCDIYELQTLTQSFRQMSRLIHDREKHIRQTAYRDALTGLDNRAFLFFALLDRIKNAREPLTLITWGADNLDSINEVLGHDISDAVLIRFACKARRFFKQSIVMARLEGNLFCTVMPRAIAKRLIEQVPHGRELNNTVHVAGYTLDIQSHAGIAHFPQDGDSPETLLRRAEIARQLAKKTQRNWIEFERKLEIRSTRRLALLTELKEAIAADQFELYFQPKLNVRNNTITQAEVLIRWNHPTRGLIAPGGFIELAEQTGLIKEISQIVLQKVHTLVSQCNTQGITLSMNLSAIDLEDSRLLDFARSLNTKHPDDARFITLEITESASMKDPEQALNILEGFSKLGYHLSIDDFGAGYSSLSYLKKFPVSELKIDRSLVQNCHKDTDSAIILESTIEMGHIMGLVVTTEGVETDEEYQQVCNLGADYVQGYWLSMPIPFDEFMAKHLLGSYAQEIQPI
ncbi:GGDEF domain-containing phosphodiesterase [Limnobacter sp.]|uniref:putative bifunctional diguanylate cyclase/phosphodiesterase n=1 Tax=Limnobacter sp. TaxID=2003368 RepID=UPI00258E9E76|nr:GGDEF domain-containing phosphodiesterase [Limnobacter sp.]